MFRGIILGYISFLERDFNVIDMKRECRDVKD